MIPAETKRLFRNRNFLHLWANHALQQIAYSMVNFALMIWVFELTGVNTAVSLWALAFLIPSLTLSVIAGVMADNYDRKKIMIATDLLWGLMVLCFTFARDSLPLILLFTFIAQGIDEFFIPSQNATLPRLVGEDELLPANSLFALTITAALVIGFLLAGPLLRFFGYSAPFALAACLIFVGALSVSFLPSVKARRPPLAEASGGKPLFASLFSHFKEEIRSELLVLARKREVFTTGLFLALIYGGMAAAGAVAPGFMEQSLQIDAKDISFVGVVPAAVGLVLGTVLIGKFGNRWGEKKMIKAGLLAFGATLLFFAFSPSLRLHLAGRIGSTVTSLADYSSRRFGVEGMPIPFERLPSFSLLIGILTFTLGTSLTFITVPVATALQRITPDAVRGRTFGTFGMLTATLTAFFVVSAGVAADLFSPTPLVALVGLIAMLFAFLRERLLGLAFAVVSKQMQNLK